MLGNVNLGSESRSGHIPESVEPAQGILVPYLLFLLQGPSRGMVDMAFI